MPKIGISSYCLAGPLERGEMDLPAVMRWAKENGAEHLELVPIGYTLLENEALCRQVAEASKELALPLSNYAIPADVLKWDEEERRAEIRAIQWPPAWVLRGCGTISPHSPVRGSPTLPPISKRSSS